MFKLIQKFIIALFCCTSIFHMQASITRTTLKRAAGLVHTALKKAPELATQAAELAKAHPGKSLYAASVLGAVAYGYRRYGKYDRELARVRKAIAPWQAQERKLQGLIDNAWQKNEYTRRRQDMLYEETPLVKNVINLIESYEPLSEEEDTKTAREKLNELQANREFQNLRDRLAIAERGVHNQRSFQEIFGIRPVPFFFATTGIIFLGSAAAIGAFHGLQYVAKRNHLLHTLIFYPNHKVTFQPLVTGSVLPSFTLIPGKTTLLDIHNFVRQQMSSSKQIRNQILTLGTLGTTAFYFQGMRTWLNERDRQARSRYSRYY
jgi:hypothetical protein